MPLVELINVSKSYEFTSDGQPLWVLKDLDLRVETGRRLAIVGPSGSGKSTLLNLIGVLDEPTDGRVLLAGQDLAQLTQRQRAGIRSRKIGFVFQMHYLLNQCTALENVLVPTLADRTDRQTKQALQQRATRLLERVGLADKLSSLPGELSGGQRQRVAVVRALINQPKLLLADEPTGSLDEASSEKLVDLLVELNHEEQVTLLMVTHSTVLAQRMDTILELAGGRLKPLTFSRQPEEDSR